MAQKVYMFKETAGEGIIMATFGAQPAATITITTIDGSAPYASGFTRVDSLVEMADRGQFNYDYKSIKLAMQARISDLAGGFADLSSDDKNIACEYQATDPATISAWINDADVENAFVIVDAAKQDVATLTRNNQFIDTWKDGSPVHSIITYGKLNTIVYS